MDNVCPCCGQRLLVRHGVRLSPKLADLFDLIERSGGRGVHMDVLVNVFHPDRSMQNARQCLAVNITHLNERLVETDLQVKADRQERLYRVVKWAT